MNFSYVINPSMAECLVRDLSAIYASTGKNQTLATLYLISAWIIAMALGMLGYGFFLSDLRDMAVNVAILALVLVMPFNLMINRQYGRNHFNSAIEGLTGEKESTYHLTLSEDGVVISTDGEKMWATWDRVHKIYAGDHAFILSSSIFTGFIPHSAIAGGDHGERNKLASTLSTLSGKALIKTGVR